MHEHGKSDRLVVPAKSPNKATAAEAVEERAWPKGTRTAHHVPDAEPGKACQTGWTVCEK